MVLLLSACNSREKIVYLQDSVFNQEETICNMNSIKVRPDDKLNIVVSCKEPKMAMLLNSVESANNINISAGQASQGNYSSSTTRTVPYTVNSKGNIDFPLLGTLHVEGMTREQVAEMIKNKIISDGIVSDPIVSVEFLNLHYSVLGEVKAPGQYAIKNEKLTLLDALSQAGDLTIYGVRDRVQVIREQDGKRIKYIVDLRSQDLFDSPAYYLQQNDVIYVEPNATKIGQSQINENNWKSVGLWISLASLVMSAAVLIFK